MSLISWLAKKNPRLRGCWPSPTVPGLPNPNEENAQWIINAIHDVKSNTAVIFQGWETAGIVSELQQLQNEPDHESPSTDVGEQPSVKLSNSTIKSIDCIFERFSPVHEYFFPAEVWHSWIDGRNGSNACTVIACLVASLFITGQLDVPGYQSFSAHPMQQFLESYANVLRDGNALYVSMAVSFGSPYLSAFEAIRRCTVLRLRMSEEIDILVADTEDGMARVTSYFDDNADKPAAGVFIAMCRSVAMLFQSSGKVVVSDSHSHGRKGALIVFATDIESALSYLCNKLLEE
jgi:hypothetical protein